MDTMTWTKIIGAGCGSLFNTITYTMDSRRNLPS